MQERAMSRAVSGASMSALSEGSERDAVMSENNRCCSAASSSDETDTQGEEGDEGDETDDIAEVVPQSQSNISPHHLKNSSGSSNVSTTYPSDSTQGGGSTAPSTMNSPRVKNNSDDNCAQSDESNQSQNLNGEILPIQRIRSMDLSNKLGNGRETNLNQQSVPSALSNFGRENSNMSNSNNVQQQQIVPQYTQPLTKDQIMQRNKNEGKNASFAITDPLGFIQSAPEQIANQAKDYLYEYGFGMCGPRGFYGTSLQHLEIEKVLADFCEKEHCVFHSHGVTIASSVLAAMITGNDIAFCDRKCHYGIKSGLRLNRGATIVFYNDLDDLEKMLETKFIGSFESFLVGERKFSQLNEFARRYVISEGIFQCDGTMCNLPKLIELKKKYNLILTLDESLSFGAVGPRGVGDSQQFLQQVNSENAQQVSTLVDEVDVIMASLEYAIGSVGGFVCGQFGLIRDLRLTSSGYCFSASAPGVSCLWSMAILNGIKNDSSVAIQNSIDLSDAESGSQSGGVKKSSQTDATIDLSKNNNSKQVVSYSTRRQTLKRNQNFLQSKLYQLEQLYDVTGSAFVVHLRPKKAPRRSGGSNQDEKEKGAQTNTSAASTSSTSSNDLDQQLSTLAEIQTQFEQEITNSGSQTSIAGARLDVWQRPRTEIELDKRLKIEKSSKKSAGNQSHPGCTPSLRITVNALHSTQQIEDFVSAVKTASEKVLLGGQCAR